LQVGFEQLNLHKIKLMAEVNNTASNNVATNVDFKLEGQLKDEIYSNGAFHDANLYGIVK
jgi:Acetyltransferases, including N-acetylases of ribosomal proteins